MKKTFIKLALCGLFTISLISPFQANAADNIHILINGTPVKFTQDSGYPFVDENNRTLVPLRITMEAAGATVGFDEKKQTAIVVKEHDRIEVPIGVDYLYNNNKKIQNDTRAVSKNNRIYLPIKAILESADYTVEWDNKTQTVNAYNFDYNSNELVPYSTGSLDTLVKDILNGNVVYLNGNYYATPEYVKMLSNAKTTYLGNDLNTAIYPEKDRDVFLDLDPSTPRWVSVGAQFDKVSVNKEMVEDASRLEENPVRPGYFYTYAFYKNGVMGINVTYIMDEITDEFMAQENATGTFNGIRVKRENGTIYFHSQDLEAHGIDW